MTALALTLTDAGRAALVDAEAGGTTAVVIAELGLTAAEFVAAPTLGLLPGEFARIAAVSGQAIDDATVHLVARDNGTDAYTVRGIGLYLSDGTLFGTYGQDAPLFEKVEVSSFFLAVDLTFAAGEAELIEFGDANFLNPPASEQVPGVAAFATFAEALAGLVADRTLTPAALAHVLQNYVAAARLAQPDGVATLDAQGKLAAAQRPPIEVVEVHVAGDEAAMLELAATTGDFAVRADTGQVFILQEAPAATLANWIELNTPAPVTSVNGKVGAIDLVPADVGAVPTARTITGTGLASGGGALTGNRAIHVPAASAEEAIAGAIADKALTPASLALVLASLAAKASGANTVTGGGLLTGGGAIGGNPVLQLGAASPAEIVAGLVANKAITPQALASLPKSLTPNGYLQLPGGFLIQWVQYRSHISGEPAIPIWFPVAFPSACLIAVATPHLHAPHAGKDLWTQVVAPSLHGCSVQLQAGSQGDRQVDGFNLLAMGF